MLLVALSIKSSSEDLSLASSSAETSARAYPASDISEPRSRNVLLRRVDLDGREDDMKEDTGSHPSSPLGWRTGGFEDCAHEVDMGEELSLVHPHPDNGWLLRNHPDSHDLLLPIGGVSTASAARLSTRCHCMVVVAYSNRF